MQINLKQVEIQAALKQYITAQGINLAGKEVEITFTAGRKEGGLTADISIEDAVIPFGDDQAEQTGSGPQLSVVTNSQGTATSAPAADPQPEPDAKAEVAAETPADATPAGGEEAQPEAAPKKVASLFG